MTLLTLFVMGREVAKLVDENKPAGTFQARWNATDVATGVYFSRIEVRPSTGSAVFRDIKKLMVVK